MSTKRVTKMFTTHKIRPNIMYIFVAHIFVFYEGKQKINERKRRWSTLLRLAEVTEFFRRFSNRL